MGSILFPSRRKNRIERKEGRKCFWSCSAALLYLIVVSLIRRANCRHDTVSNGTMATIAMKNKALASSYSQFPRMGKQSSARGKALGLGDTHTGRIELLIPRKKYLGRIQACILGLVSLHFLSTIALVSSQLVGSGIAITLLPSSSQTAVTILEDANSRHRRILSSFIDTLLARQTRVCPLVDRYMQGFGGYIDFALSDTHIMSFWD